MKLTFKDLKQQKFIIEAEPTETIAEVKGKISQEKGWEASTQKLIYSGKILQDDNTIESYKIEEKGFIVCMTTKPKPAPAAAAPPATPAPASTTTTSTPAAPQAAPAGTTGAAPPATPSPAPASAASGGRETFNDPSALAMGEQRNAAIANMEAMGFPRSDIDRAMRAAFYNPDRAVEYLLNGIPESALREQAGPGAGAGAGGAQSQTVGSIQGSTPTTTQAGAGGDQAAAANLFDLAAQSGRGSGGQRGASGGTGAGSGAGAGGLDAAIAAGAGTGDDGRPNFDFLRNNPIFQQLRQVVQQQPQMLEPILQQVAAGNPQLAQIISQHPEDFMQLLAEDVDGDAPLPAGAQQIAVSEEEREAIERLCRLGFERDLVIQAYFACDKNEELAANFLFDHPDDNEEGQE